MISPIHALSDNYIWILTQADTVLVVDPGEADPVISWLYENAKSPSAILITHTHHDHIGGVADIVRAFPDCAVYGSDNADHPSITHRLRPGQSVQMLGIEIETLDLAGHTPDQMGYYLPQFHALFCGDTLFAGGCGRLFNGGTAEQMTASLQRIAQLPEDTHIYCAHEYTLANLRFATMVEPENFALQLRLANTQDKRRQSQDCVPSLLKEELATNPFLRTETEQVHQAIDHWSSKRTNSSVERFLTLRAWKDSIDATGQLDISP